MESRSRGAAETPQKEIVRTLFQTSSSPAMQIMAANTRQSANAKNIGET